MDFEKSYISKSVGVLLQENLRQDDVKTLNRILQGKKAQYQAANSLLTCVLRALVNRNEGEETEFEVASDGDIEDTSSQEPPLAQQEQQQRQIVTNPGASEGAVGNRPSSKEATQNKTPPKNKRKELCRFYARGHCNRNKDCRFGHPDICKKFRVFGSKSTDPKGCDGKCNAFHPNACRSSLSSRICTFNECRFFHLKGTRKTNTGSNMQHNQHSQPRNRTESKNWRRHSPDRSPNQPPGNAPQGDPGVRDEEKIQIAQTLEAIMKRLSAMEARQTVYLHPAMNLHTPAQPVLSPAVPMPGSQTQQQWGSQNQWPQSQF